MTTTTELKTKQLLEIFGDALQQDVDISRYTSSRTGGRADYLLSVRTVEELTLAIQKSWEYDLPFFIMGGGSNILISDQGIRDIVILNRAKKIRFDVTEDSVIVLAESGANIGRISRQAGMQGYSGLEWAEGIPGTLGGAIVGNAGAHGSDISKVLISATILQRFMKEDNWYSKATNYTPNELGFEYRSSKLKRRDITGVVLGAYLRLNKSSSDQVLEEMQRFSIYRKQSQPPGASLGSMFKNPSGEYAGRLIEEVGLKGYRIGDAEISQHHGNFFINHGNASSEDILNLIRIAQKRVLDHFDIKLELEIELVGDRSETTGN